MSYQPRAYQKEAINAVLKCQRDGARAALLHLPTGSGKTVIATLIIEQLLRQRGVKRILFVAHRREILQQTASMISRHLPTVSVGIEQGTNLAGNAQIVVGSRQSLIKRKHQYQAGEFQAIFCDEAHHALASTWTDLIDHFRNDNSRAPFLIGTTATPRRTDGKSALEIFGEVAYEIPLTTLQDLGYLASLEYFAVKTDLDLAKVKMSAGDFQVQGLSKVMNTLNTRKVTLKAWFECGVGKKTLVFCAGVEHAHQLAGDFNAMGITAAAIDGKTLNRDQLLLDFRDGRLAVVTNYGILTEGFDDPSIECIVLARPTTSPLVYTQCLGRGLRRSPTKASCTVIDIVDRSAHPLQYNAMSLAGLSKQWRSRGRDPFRDSLTVSKIRVTDPLAFIEIRAAGSLNDVQAILTRLPPETVLAGLDGMSVLRYEPIAGRAVDARALEAARKLLVSSAAPFKSLAIENEIVSIGFANVDEANMSHSLLKWHIKRATGWDVEYHQDSAGKLDLRRLLRSLLTSQQRIQAFQVNENGRHVTATISGLSRRESANVAGQFVHQSGMTLNVRGQVALDLFG